MLFRSTEFDASAFSAGGPRHRDIPASLAGYFLISDTELVDPNFYRTVVLLIHHDDEGAFGLVVNRRSEVNLSSVLPGFESHEAGNVPIFVGGPVQQEYFFALHGGFPRSLQRAEGKIPPAQLATEGVYFEPVTEPMVDYLLGHWDELAPDDKPYLHMFAGYSGWGAGQLEDEIREGAWVLVPAQADVVFKSDPDKAWQDALAAKGELYKIIATTGFKPSLN